MEKLKIHISDKRLTTKMYENNFKNETIQYFFNEQILEHLAKEGMND